MKSAKKRKSCKIVQGMQVCVRLDYRALYLETITIILHDTVNVIQKAGIIFKCAYINHEER